MRCKISFRKAHLQSFEVERGVNLMKALLEAGRPVASSCGGEGICAKCKMSVVQGAQNLNPPNEQEHLLKEREGLALQERISCQCVVLGDVEIDTKYW